jgi:sulfane dehydrogenase subunit SoxC
MFKIKKPVWWVSPILLLTFLALTPSSSQARPVLSPLPSFLYGVPEKNINEYRLIVDGSVDSPLSLDFETVMQYPTISRTVLLDCPGEFQQTNEWTGIPVTDLLVQAGLKPQANRITFYALDNYKMSFPLKTVLKDNFLAYKIDGKLLSRMDGYPLRLVVPDHVGADWVRWINRIEITEEPDNEPSR